MKRPSLGTVAWCTGVAAAIAMQIAMAIHAHQEQLRWEQRATDAWTAIEANQTALISAPATGQDPQQLLRQCQAAVADYNAAATQLNTELLDPRQECQP